MRISTPPGADAAGVEPLAAGDCAAAAGLLARAFRDNPLNRAVIGEPAARRLRCNLVSMRVQVPLAREHGLALAVRGADGLAGVLVAAPPGSFPFPLPSWRERLRILRGQGLRVAHRWAAVAEQLREAHWIGPHWYLSTVGVDPPLWGAGLGTSLLRAWLARVDRDGSSAYLETDLERNLSFYRRAGFRVQGETRVLGVPVWLMLRPPRAHEGGVEGGTGREE